MFSNNFEYKDYKYRGSNSDYEIMVDVMFETCVTPWKLAMKMEILDLDLKKAPNQRRYPVQIYRIDGKNYLMAFSCLESGKVVIWILENEHKQLNWAEYFVKTRISDEFGISFGQMTVPETKYLICKPRMKKKMYKFTGVEVMIISLGAITGLLYLVAGIIHFFVFKKRYVELAAIRRYGSVMRGQSQGQIVWVLASNQ